MLEALDDSRPDFRREAAGCLAQLEDARAVEALIVRLGDEDEWVVTSYSVQQRYATVIDSSSAVVPQEIKDDPYLFRGFFCSRCRRAHCPSCCNMQGEICPSCDQPTLLPAYRPLLRAARSHPDG